MTDTSTGDPQVPAPLLSTDLLPEHLFGPVSPELPLAIGQVVMLSALLESKIAALASGLGGEEQSVYASNDLRQNLTICKRQLPLYERNDSEARFAQLGLAVLEESRTALEARNAIVHRVWPQAGLAGWGGWKPLRRAEPKSVAWTEWTNFSKQDFAVLIANLATVIGKFGDIIASAGAFPRHAAMTAGSDPT